MLPKYLTIQEAAEKLQVSIETLRRWDAKGVLVPERTAGNQRRYTLQQIQLFKNRSLQAKSKHTVLTIQEASEFLHVTPETLRRWDERGALVPIRTPGNQRRYTLGQLDEFAKGGHMKPPVVVQQSQQNIAPPLPAQQPKETVFTSVVQEIQSVNTRPDDSIGVVKNLSQNISNDKQAEQKSSFFSRARANNSSIGENQASRFGLMSAGAAVIALVLLGALSLLPLGRLPLFESFQKSPVISGGNLPGVLASDSRLTDFQLIVNLPALFNESVNLKKGLEVTGGIATLSGGLVTNNQNGDFGTGIVIASNIPTVFLDSVVPGQGIGVNNADPRNPTISNNGVLSLQGSTGAISLAAGSGISISGLTISSTVTAPSASNSFTNIAVTGQSTVTAGSPTDTLTFVAGTGIALTTDAGSKELTINATAGSSQWTTSGTSIYYNAGNVGIGTSTPLHRVELIEGITEADGIGFGTDVALFRGAADRLDLAGGDRLNLASGSLEVGGTAVVTATRMIRSADGLVGSPAYSFSSDTTTGLYLPSATILGFSTGGAERMRIGSDGNIGIGMTTPATQVLDVTGNIRASGNYISGGSAGVTLGAATCVTTVGGIVTGSGACAAQYWQQSNGALSPTNITDDVLVGGVATGSALIKLGGTANATSFFNTGGNVGIGTTSPSSFMLEVAGNIGPDVDGVRDIGSPSRVYNAIYVNNIFPAGTGIQGYWQRIANAISPTNISDDVLLGGNATASALVKLGGTTNATTFFNTGGNVGIGTTSPSTLLHVSGGSGIVGQFSGRVQGGDAQNPDEFATLGQITGGVGQYWQRLLGAVYPTNITDDVLVGGSATASALTRLGGTVNATTFFNTGGNVGIGTTAPIQRLDVVGNIRASGNYISGANTGVTVGVASCVTTTGGIVTGTATCGSGSGGSKWTELNGAISPYVSSLDVLIGSTATSTAKFAFMNVDSGIPTASISGNLAIAAPSGVNPATTYTALNGGTIDLRTSAGGDSGATSRLFVANNGNIGVGTTTPTSNMQISQNVDAITQLLVTNASSGNSASSRVELDADGGAIVFTANSSTFTGPAYSGGADGAGLWTNTALSNGISIAARATTGAVRFYTGGNSERMRIDANGNVGIGTTSPAGLLSVSGSSATGQSLMQLNQTGSSDIFTASASGTTRFTIANNGTLTASAYGVGVAQFNASGVLSSSALNLAGGSSYVTGILPIANGGTNTNTIGSAGSIAYSNGTSYAFSAAGTSGQVLVSGGSGAPTWLTIDGTINFWQRNLGALSPLNVTDDVLLGGTATSSALVRFGATSGANSFFNTGGYVGIGTTNPSAKATVYDTTDNTSLDVRSYNGGLDVLNGGGNYSLIRIGNGTSASTADGTYLQNITNANNNVDLAFGRFLSTGVINEYMRLTNSGTLGIGTTAPTAMLDITGSSGASTSGVLTFRGTTDPSINFLNGENLNFQSSVGGNGGLTSRLFINGNSGNIGIGTTSPANKLQVGNDTSSVLQVGAAGGVYLFDSAAGQQGGSLAFNGYYNGTDYIAGATGGSVLLQESAAGLGFWTAPSVTAGSTLSYTSRLFLNYTSGNFGIGNTSPGATLDVTGTLRSSGLITANGGLTVASGQSLTLAGLTANGGVLYANGSGVVAQTTAGSAGQCLQSIGGGAPAWGACNGGSGLWNQANGTIYPANSTLDLLVGGQATSSAKFAVLNMNSGTPIVYADGNVGIGLTNPSQRLYVYEENNADVHFTLETAGTNKAAYIDLVGTHTSFGGINYEGGGSDQWFIGNRGDVAGSLNLYTSSSLLNRMTILSGGNVGIGTTNPTQKLELGSGNVLLPYAPSAANGNLFFGGDTSAGTNGMRMFFVSSLSDGFIDVKTTAATDGLVFRADTTDGSSERLRITSGGNIGIATSAPTALLDINGATGASTSGILTFRGTTDPQINFLNGEDLIFRSSVGGTTGLATRMQITNNGNVGIGTTGPIARLQVNAQADGVGIDTNEIKLWNNGNAHWSLFNASATGDFWINDTSGAAAMGTVGTNRFTILESSGNVGIGTTNPSVFKLQVNGNIGPETDNTYDLGATSSGRFRDLYLGPTSFHLQCLTGDGCGQNVDWSMGIATSGTGRNSLQIGANRSSFTSGVPSLTLTEGGNIGIGTTTPIGKLDVAGNIYTTNSGKIYPGNNSISISSVAADRLRFVDENSGSGATAFYQYFRSGTNNPVELQLFGTDFGADSTNYILGSAIMSNSTGMTLRTLRGGSNTGSETITFSPANSPAMTLLSGGNVGIGTTAPLGKLHTVGTQTATNTPLYGNLFQQTVNGTLTGDMSSYGIFNTNDISGTDAQFTHNALGQYNYINLATNSTVDGLYSSYNDLFVSSSRLTTAGYTATSAASVIGNATNQGGGRVGGLVGGQFTAFNTGSSTTDSLYGVLGNATRGSGTVTTAYGGYFTATGATNNFGVYSAAGNNYFNGNVGIGTTNPSSFKLQVDGNIGPNADNTYDLGASSSGRFRDLYLGPTSLHVQCTTGDGCGQNIDWSMGIATSGTARNSLQIGVNKSSFTSGNPTLSLAENGNVGIGIANSTKKLYVAGKMYAERDADVPARSYVTRSGWTSRTGTESNTWKGVAWSPELGLFVAVSEDGTNRVMTSSDGVNWTARSASNANSWEDVTWSPELGLFVAVSEDGTNRVMTSPDGINWTGRSVTAASWQSVTWSPELGLFVAVAFSGSPGAMTSPDGINWTDRTAVSGSWMGVTWSPELNLFVAVAQSDSGKVMTSSDGITWVQRTGVNDTWQDIIWSPELNLFVAVSVSGTNPVETSPDGITWTARSAPGSNLWHSVTWSAELGIFLAAGQTSGGSDAIYSTDGINWTNFGGSNPTGSARGVVWSPEFGMFVTVGSSGSVNTSANSDLQPIASGANVLFAGETISSSSSARTTNDGSGAVYNALGDSNSMVPNGSFEATNFNGVTPDGWVFSATNSASLALTTSTAAHGSNSLQFTTTGTNQFAAAYSACFPIQNSSVYSGSFAQKSNTAGGATVRVYLDMYTSKANCNNNTGALTSSQTIPTATTASWSRVLHNLIATGASDTWARAHIWIASATSGAGATTQVDAIRFVPNNSGAGMDYAENFPADPADVPQAGDVVSIQEGGIKDQVGKSTVAMDQSVIGIVATKPGMVLDDGTIPDPKVPVALAGRVPVKVSTANGPIKKGDYLTSSTMPGVAVKAIKSGPTIGKAMDDFACAVAPMEGILGGESGLTDGLCTGEVTVFVNISHYSPAEFSFSDTGNVSIFKNPADITGLSYTAKNGDKVIERKEVFSDIVTGVLKTGVLYGSKVIIDGKDVMDIINEKLGSGSMTATESAQINTKFADIEGILKQVQDDVKSVQDDVKSAQDDMVILQAQQAQTASETAFLREVLAGGGSSVLGASSSGSLGVTDDETVINGDLTVLGRTRVADLGITGSLTAGVLSIDGLAGELNTIGEPLKIQSHAAAPVEIMDGKVVIETDGDIITKGIVRARKIEVDESDAQSKSVGVVVVPSGDTTLDVDTTALTLNSHILVTPEKALTVVAAKRKDADTLTITLKNAVEEDLKIHWLIVN